jgi:hypothetical protein
MPATITKTKKTPPKKEDVFTKNDFLNALRKVSIKKVPVKPSKHKVKQPSQEKIKTSE